MGTGWRNTTNATFLTGSGFSYGDQGQAITYNGPDNFSSQNNMAVPHSTNSQGYAFGQGQTCRGIYNMGYGGGGGSGMYGGYAGVDGRGGGAAGAGYYGKTYGWFGGGTQSLEYDGRVEIKYVGAVQQAIVIDPNNGGQFNGVSEVKQYTGQANSDFWLGDPQPKSGYEFLYWIKTTNTGAKSTIAKGGRTVQYDWQTTTYKAVWKAPLTLTADNVGTGMVQLYINEPDEFNKYYRIKKQTDNANWQYINDTSSWISDTNKSGNVNSNTSQNMIAGNWWFSIRGGCGGRNYGNQPVGAGGTSKGSTVADTTKTIYWVIGGNGGDSGSKAGGYNGGGSGGGSGGAGGGGGCNINVNQYNGISQTSRSNFMLVASGGGGTGRSWDDAYWNSHGGGGGGVQYGQDSIGQTDGGRGAQQSGGGWYNGSYGQGGYGNGQGGGGGAGLYGGGGGSGEYTCGGGGSGLEALQGGGNAAPYYTREPFQASGSWTYSDKKTSYPLLTQSDFTDQAAPNIPLDNGISYQNNKIQVNYIHNGDNGTLTYFKAWQYNSDDGQLLRESNVVQLYYKQGVRGYRYKVQSSNQYNVTNSDTFTEQTVYETTGQSETRYLHVAAVDWKGNIGPTLHIYIPNSVAINYYKNSQSATGTDGQLQLVAYGKTERIKTVKDLGIKLVNNRFKFWTTNQNGTGTKYLENEQVQYNTLVQRHGYKLNLYANWEPTYVLYIDPNGGSWYDGYDIKRSSGAQVTQDFQLAATKQTYNNKIQFRMGHGDIKTIQDAIKLGYNFRGWSIKI